MNDPGSGRRSDCPVAGTLDLLGDRWSLLVVRDLLGGKRHFDEFLSAPEGIATNVLSDRLARLESERLVARKPDPQDGRRVTYRLTPRGLSLLPVIAALRDWGLAHIAGTNTRAFSELNTKTGKTGKTGKLHARVEPARRAPQAATKVRRKARPPAA